MNGATTNGYTMLVTNNKAFVLNEHSPDDVARAMIESGRQKEPFYIFDMDEVSRCVQRMRDLVPRVQIFYAMKANDYDMTLKLAVALGLGFDCSSPGEIFKLKKHNVGSRSIIYASPIKTPDQMIFARESGVQHTTVDSSCEIKKLKQYWPEAKILLRVRVDSDSAHRLGDKYGCDFDTEAICLLEEAASLGLKVIGIAFHVGSCCWSAESYKTGLRYVRALFDHEAKAGRKMTIIDIGGGFIADKSERLDKVAKIINSTLDKMFPDPNLQIISECGRYIIESSFKLYCNICSIGKVTKNYMQLNSIYLNNGFHGALRYFEDWYSIRKFTWSNEIDSSPLEKTILWGPSCDTRDQVRGNLDIRLPRLHIHDWLVFDYQGAYTFVFQTKFSSFEATQIRPVISSALWNKIKDRKIFTSSDFVLRPDISMPLPSTLPPVVNTEGFEHPQMPRLLD